MLKLAANNIELAVKGKSLFNISRAFNEALPDCRHAVTCSFTEHVLTYRNFTPAKEFESFLFTKSLKHLHGLGPYKFILWEEEHTDTVVSFFPKCYTDFFCFFLEELVGNLHKDSDTVTGFSGRIFTCTVLKFFNNAKSIVYDLVCLLSINIDYCTDSACIMFKLWLVKCVSHTVTPDKNKKRRLTHRQKFSAGA